MKPSISVIAAARRFFASPERERFERKKEPEPRDPASLLVPPAPSRSPSPSLLPRRASPCLSAHAAPLLARNEGMLTRCSAPTFMEMHPLIYPGPACSRLCLTSVLREVYYPPRPPFSASPASFGNSAFLPPPPRRDLVPPDFFIRDRPPTSHHPTHRLGSSSYRGITRT